MLTNRLQVTVEHCLFYCLVYCIFVTNNKNDHPCGMPYWLFNTVWIFNRGLTNLTVIQQNEDCEKAKYPSHDKSDSKWFYLCYAKIKQVKDHCLDTVHSVSVVLVWYILTEWPFYRGEDSKK